MSSASLEADPTQTGPDPVGTLLSVNVGMPKDVPWQGKTVFTGVFKDPVSGPRGVHRLNVDGDGQGDLAGHGGEQRTALARASAASRGSSSRRSVADCKRLDVKFIPSLNMTVLDEPSLDQRRGRLGR